MGISSKMHARTTSCQRNYHQRESPELAKSLELTGFRTSDGWLDKWKQRYNVIFKAVSRDENTVTPEMTASWSDTYLPTILSKYELKDIYNGDEFGLFYQALPDKSLHYKGERCSGGKHSKVRFTGLAAGNTTGKNCPCLSLKSLPNHVVLVV